MDASQVIKLKLARMGSYTHPYKTVDSSTYTDQLKLKTRHYLPKTPDCTGILYDPVSISPCEVCGQGATTSVSTNTTRRLGSVLNGQMGSGTRVYSTEAVLLQKASRAMCAQPTEPSAVIVPPQYCESNSEEQPIVNPYQPPYDVQYFMKHPSCTVCYKGFENSDMERCQCKAVAASLV